MQPEEWDQTEKQRATLRRFGVPILIIGVAFWAIAIFDFFITFASFGRGDGEPRVPLLFFLGFLGGPMTMVGGIMTALGYSKEIIRFFTNTFSSATGKDVFESSKPPPRPQGPIDRADSDSQREIEIACPTCHRSNSSDAVFCQGCGNRLVPAG